MASIFTRIINGEIPAYKVAETEDFLAFLDINPLKKGHTLVIPKEETDYLFDLSDETYMGLQIFAKAVAGAIQKAIPCKRIGTAVLGMEVPHAHIHLVPLDVESDLSFSKERVKLTEEEFEEVAASIRDAF